MATTAPLQQRSAPPARSIAGTPLSRLQTKLEVGASGDHFEREADRVAGTVMRGGDAPVAIPPSIARLGAQRKAVSPKPVKEEEPKKTGKAAKVQRKAVPIGNEEEKKSGGKTGKVQRDTAAGAAGGTASASVAHAIGAMQAGSASGLDGTARGFMEGRFGRDFSRVRVHDGPRAAATAATLGARAFTVGNDIFFNQGQYQPHSSGGQHLLAHELTHTIQQAGSSGMAVRKRIQRQDEDDSASAPLPTSVPSSITTTTPAAGRASADTPSTFTVPGFAGASIDITNVGAHRGTITLPTLALPQIANALKGTEGGLNVPVAAAGRTVPRPGRSFTLEPPAPARKDTIAAETWTAGASAELAAGVLDKLTKMHTSAADAADVIAENGKQVYYLTFRGATAAHRDNIFVGELAELAKSDVLLRPQWTPNGSPLTSLKERLDADHFLEAQLGGEDAAENMWLLQASYNRSVGSQIGHAIRNDIRRVVENVRGIPPGEEPTNESVDAHWIIRFADVARGSGFARATQIFWTRNQIRAGEHLEHLKFMTKQELIAANIGLAPGHRPEAIDVYPGPSGGRRATFSLNGTRLTPPQYFFYGLTVNSATYLGDTALTDPGAPLMSLNLTAFRTREGVEYLSSRTTDVTVRRNLGLGIAGYIDPAGIRARFGRTDFPGLSPLAFADMGINAEGMLTGTGTVASSKAMLPGLQVPLMLEGERIMMRFGIPVDGISLGPISVTEASLGLGYGPNGLLLEGYAGIAVSSLGTGALIAEVSEAGPSITGQFNLAVDFLNPASVAVTYDLANDRLTGNATLGVEQGRIPGVDSGAVTVNFSREAVAVSGTINLGGPLRGAVVNVTYNQTDGLKIGADNIPLPFANAPAVQNAILSVSASKAPNAESWSFAGHGTATLAVPGATGTLFIDYLDGAVTIHGQGGVERGPASGTIDFIATNRQIDAEGRPIEGPVADGINAWGRGNVTIRFGRLLTGTAGIEYTPGNRIIVSGTIAMPPVYEVFPRRDYTKDILTLSPPEFPIWGVSVAGYGIGIFAFVDARVFFEAYVGPGQIRDAAVTATLDLDRPEDAAVDGHGEFYVPAYAGFGLDVGGGLRARLAVAYAQGRVGLTGRLGVEAGAGAIIDFDWSRADGLSLNADLHAEATPKFDLSATASVTVGVDLLLTEIEHTWGPWARQLGSFGPDMTLGVLMPVHWSEANGLDLSLDNIEVARPQLDASALMTDVFDRLAA